MTSKEGTLKCVGIGILLGGHLTPRARTAIGNADRLFMAVSNPIVEKWLEGMHPDARSLQDFYRPGRPRDRTYQDMQETILQSVREGLKVCAAFYGHPGVFACVAHRTIAAARQEGFVAHMEAGISAEDCLYADLGIDPGTWGCQHYEATQFLLRQRQVDASAYLVLWQVGVVGDESHTRLTTGRLERKLLLAKLLRWYPENHRVTVYEAATLPVSRFRSETIPLKKIVTARLTQHSTLVIPPAKTSPTDDEMQQLLAKAVHTQQD